MTKGSYTREMAHDRKSGLGREQFERLTFDVKGV
jgi:stalled ribosome alternative rescue factor ArfA